MTTQPGRPPAHEPPPAPKPTPTPPPPKPAASAQPAPAYPATTVAPPSAEPADAPVRTTADEQRERSAEIEKMGVEKWIEAHDQRSPEDRKGRVVEGVANVKAEHPK